ncbi:hypothetical protein KR222_004317 [Zaprionus bogoriensis]|nr:hypothetical protein KR222_004317 [Zaprionus bogoriensis]
MMQFNNLFSKLKVQFARNITWNNVEDWLYEDEDDAVNQQGGHCYWSLPICQQNAPMQDYQLQVLRELASCIRTVRNSDIENQNSFDVTYDNWATIEDISAQDYLAYIYAVTSLAVLPPHIADSAPEPVNEAVTVQLALSAVSTYLLTLTIPGAKSYGIFDEGVIEQCLKVFRLLEGNANNSGRANSIWITILTICDDLKLVFRYVHFKDHLRPRDKIIRVLLSIFYMNFKMGYSNSCARQLHTKCFELLDEITNEQNGDVYQTLMLLMNQTFAMHIYMERGNGPQSGEHISDWFIKLLEKYPNILTRVLEFYIRCVITNPIREWKSCDERVAVGYAAKYDAALYAKCNKSSADFLIECIRADDAVGVQVRSLELIERILQQQTEVEWSIFRHDVSTTPREVALIKETIESLDDKTFTVRRKASQVLNLIIRQGSPITMRILHESIGFAQFDDVKAPPEPSARQLELSAEKPGVVQYAYSFEGYEQLEPVVKRMPQIIYERFLDNNNGLARCAGIALLERLVLLNPRIIYDTHFEREISMLAVDMLSSVRKAVLESIDTLLGNYNNCTILIEVYCRIWPCRLNDDDVSLQRLAMQSFNRNVLMNIQPLEYTNEPQSLLPWRILTTLLTMQPRDYLQQRFAVLLQHEQMVTPQLVNLIISHLTTTMATEAWSLLLLVSSRITINLDSLITTFNRLSSYNMKSNQVLALQVISYCLRNFSKSALNQLFQRLLEALRSGSIWLALVSPAMLLLNHISQLSHSQAPDDADASVVERWQLQLLEDVTENTTQCMGNFQREHIRMSSLLATYSELIVMLPEHADLRIVQFVLNYLQLCTELGESSFDTDNERIMNWMVVVAGRLSLKDNNLANRLSKIYGHILNKNDRPQLINSTLIGLNDLGKKYPTILENNMKCILVKLSSKYATTRVRTYRCVKDVILAGNIKLRGPILVSLLAGLVDESAEVAREADAFFMRYMKLYDTMLFHHCLKESPFDFNDQAFLSGSTRLVSSFKSPLKGAANAKSRRLLYNHIMATLDENTLLLYFGQLKLLAEKTKDNVFIASRGALDVIMDILFIMRRICFCTKAKAAQGGAQADGEAENAGEEELLPPVANTEQLPTEAANNSVAKAGRGRGARKRDMSEEPLKQLERCLRYVAETHHNLRSVMNSELQLEFEKFCRAMTMRFSNYTDFAQPKEFWQQYKQSSRSNRPKRKRRRLNEEGDDAAEDEAYSDADSDSDSELPLDRHKLLMASTGSVENRGSYDVLATELIFHDH